MVKQSKTATHLVGYFKTFTTSIAVCFLGVVIINLIPNSWVEGNVTSSLEALAIEGDHPALYSQGSSNPPILDNFTDGVMVSKALQSDSLNFIENAMDMRDYGRYWHGYLVFLKPALVFTDIHTIRVLITIVFLILLFVLTSLIYRHISRFLSIVFILSVALFAPSAIMISLQFSNMFILTFIASIATIVFLIEGKSTFAISRLFLIIGIATSFFDLLTTPLLTVGIPILLLIAFRIKTENSLSKKLPLELLQYLCLWGLGYGLAWFAKWVIASVILRKNMIEDGLKAFSSRASTDQGEATWLGSVSRSRIIRESIDRVPMFRQIAIALGGLSIIGVTIAIKARKIAKKAIAIIPIVVIALLPFAWFMFAANHSAIHNWFTYRSILVAIFAGFVLVWHLLRQKVATWVARLHHNLQKEYTKHVNK